MFVNVYLPYDSDTRVFRTFPIRFPFLIRVSAGTFSFPLLFFVIIRHPDLTVSCFFPPIDINNTLAAIKLLLRSRILHHFGLQLFSGLSVEENAFPSQYLVTGLTVEFKKYVRTWFRRSENIVRSSQSWRRARQNNLRYDVKFGICF